MGGKSFLRAIGNANYIFKFLLIIIIIILFSKSQIKNFYGIFFQLKETLKLSLSKNNRCTKKKIQLHSEIDFKVQSKEYF